MEAHFDNTKAVEIYNFIYSKTGLSRRDVAETAGINYSHLSSALNGKVNFTQDMEQRIRNAFPEIFGSSRTGLPYYDVDILTVPEKVFGKSKVEPKEMVMHPFNLDASMWVTCCDDAMTPQIYRGDMLAIREVSTSDIVFGKTYVVLTDNANYIRKVRTSADGAKLRLVPENINDYDVQEIPVSTVVGMYKVISVSRLL